MIIASMSTTSHRTRHQRHQQSAAGQRKCKSNIIEFSTQYDFKVFSTKCDFRVFSPKCEFIVYNTKCKSMAFKVYSTKRDSKVC